MTPLVESGGEYQLEGVSAGQRSFLVEVVVDVGMDGGEFLQTSHAPETLHRAFASSKRQMRILDAVVEPPARLLFFERAQFYERSLVGSEAICDDLFGATVPLHQFLEEFQCRLLVSTLRDDGLKHFTFLIDGTPEVVALVLSDEFEPVSIRPVTLSFIQHQVRATRQERRFVST